MALLYLQTLVSFRVLLNLFLVLEVHLGYHRVTYRSSIKNKMKTFQKSDNIVNVEKSNLR